MALFTDLIATLPDGQVEDVWVGLHWTMVTVREEAGSLLAGLATTQAGCCTGSAYGPSVAASGRLTGQSVRELARLALSERPTEVSIGLAAINAMLNHLPADLPERNADDFILTHGAGKRVVIVGHFPFVDAVRARAGDLKVLELDPKEGDTPAAEAPQCIPQADLVAITGSTLSNGTFEGLAALCRPEAHVLLLGPSTPFSPLLFRYGVEILSGTVVEDIQKVAPLVTQGANFRQIHRGGGVRLVTLSREDF